MKILGIEVEKKAVKNINLRIKSDGAIYISVPLNLPDKYIEDFIISKKSWIDKNMHKINRYLDMKKNLDLYTDNSNILFLGKIYRLKIKKADENLVIIKDNTVYIESLSDDSEYIKQLIYSKLYYQNAKKLFTKRLNYYLNLTNNEQINELRINYMKTKWGTCVPKKRKITLNVELMKKNELEIDSVIIHEIAHLIHPNHSRDFYNYIDRFFKNYREINKKLNEIF